MEGFIGPPRALFAGPPGACCLSVCGCRSQALSGAAFRCLRRARRKGITPGALRHCGIAAFPFPGPLESRELEVTSHRASLEDPHHRVAFGLSRATHELLLICYWVVVILVILDNIMNSLLKRMFMEIMDFIDTMDVLNHSYCAYDEYYNYDGYVVMISLRRNIQVHRSITGHLASAYVQPLKKLPAAFGTHID